MDTIRILLADNHKLVAQALSRMLTDEPGLTVVGVAADGEEAVRLAARHRPDVVLLALTLPRLNGIEATRRICSRVAGAKVIISAESEDEKYFLAAVRAGAYGYVLRSTGFDVLVKSIRGVVTGEPAISRAMVGPLLGEVETLAASQEAGRDALASPITPREREVLRLLVDGRTYREIAERLCIGETTVRTHIQHMQEKLHLPNRTQLITFAVTNHLLEEFPLTAATTEPTEADVEAALEEGAPAPAEAMVSAAQLDPARPVACPSDRRSWWNRVLNVGNDLQGILKGP